MKKNVFIYGGTNPSFIKEIYKNLNVCFSIHSNEGIEKNENHQNLIINNFKFIPQFDKEISKIFIDFYNENIITFLKMYVRGDRTGQDFHEDNNNFSLYFYAFYEILKKKKINLILFNSFPHQGADFILYKLAKKLNIKTILFHQTIFPKKYIMISDLKDYGKFNNIKTQCEPNEVEKILSLKDIYSKFQLNSVLKNKKKENSLISKIINIFKKKRYLKSLILKIFIYIKILKRPNYENEYIKNMREISLKDEEIIELLEKKDKKIIYFPLQSQPEMATSLCAYDYDDQIRVIERLNSILDENWIIIVKDHYIQTSYQRRKLFFRRLKYLKNIFFADKEFDSKKILNKADVVATVGGTSGWEALTRKKNCLLFGSSWYSDLFGVLKVSNETKDEEILNHINKKFVDEKFNISLVNLYNSFYDGLLPGLENINFTNEFWNLYFDEKYDEKENTDQLISNLNKFIEKNNL